MRRAVEAGRILRCPKCKDGLVKPGIVFFGEELPERFSLSSDDLPQCDLLIVMGTSLVVFPFAGLVGMVGEDCPRLLINREKAAEIPEEMFQQGARRNGFFWGEGNVRDALYLVSGGGGRGPFGWGGQHQGCAAHVRSSERSQEARRGALLWPLHTHTHSTLPNCERVKSCPCFLRLQLHAAVLFSPRAEARLFCPPAESALHMQGDCDQGVLDLCAGERTALRHRFAYAHKCR